MFVDSWPKVNDLIIVLEKLTGGRVAYEIVRGKTKQPFNVILFGVPGIGKSTWAAQSQSPIFLGGEETGELDVSRFPQSKSYADVLGQLNQLILENKDLKYKTLVIDTLDSIEALLHQKLLSEDPKQTGSMIASHGGYGKAYEMAANDLTKLRELLNTLRHMGMNIILLAHSKKVQATDTILGMQYDTYELNLHQKAQNVFVDWVSAVLFANYVVHQQSGTNTDRVFATGDGERLLLTEKRPGHLGKNRFSLPYEMPLKFDAFFDLFNKFFSDGPGADAIGSTILGLIENLEDKKLKDKIIGQMTSASNDVQKLLKIEARVREIVK